MIEHIPRHLQPVPDPGPYEPKRPCGTCGAYLLRTNPGPYCDPCRRTRLAREVDNVFELSGNVVDLHPEDEVA